uniref:PsbP C-terminal domain-containing protein n=1 Tax=Populus trichocarpa TaxID=3694 RepID=A0A2K1ZC31_POPTR
MTTSSLPANLLLAEEIPKNYPSSVNFEDGYPYYYPSDWIDFDFRGHYSAFKDRTRQLQNVRKTVDGKKLFHFSTDLHLQTATIAIANGRSCTLIVTVEKISQSA